MQDIKTDKKQRGKKVLGNIIKFIGLPLIGLVIFNWKVGLGILGFFVLVGLIKVKIKGYFIKDLKGNKLSFRKFMKRWKAGIEGITPLQQAKTNLMGTWIVISGIIGGIIINLLVRMGSQWIWIEVILIGSLIVTVIQMIGGLQKYWRFKEIDKIQKEVDKQMEKLE